MESELQSWKDIAAHLGVSIRTAQLWETQNGLPVHRLPGGRGRVMARVEELDAWSAARVQEDIPREPQEPAAAVAPHTKRIPLRLLSVGLTCFAAGALGMWLYLRPAPLHHFTVDGAVLTAYTRTGQVSWTYGLQGAVQVYGREVSTQVQQTDLDGDGEDEIVTAVVPLNDTHSVICLDSRGNVRWKRDLGGRIRTLQGKVYEPPFRLLWLKVLRGRSGELIGVLVVGVHHKFHPTQVLLLDANGKTLQEYWHSGHLHLAQLFDFQRDGKPELVMAGINQSLRTVELLVLDPEKMTGASQEDNESYQIGGMPVGVELARLALSKSELNLKLNHYNAPSTLFTKSDSIVLDVNERFLDGYAQAVITFEFDRNLKVKSISPSDQYLSVQQSMLRDGKISKALTREEMLQEASVHWLRRWDVLAH